MTLIRNRAYAYQMFDELEKGQVIVIKNETTRPDVLVQYGKDYIDKGGNIMFSGDYSKVIKTTPLAEIIAIADQFETQRNE